MSSRASPSNPIISSDLASLYECPVCYEYMLPPILQCSNGHMVCSSCSPKLTCCPSCQAPLGTSRNFALEKVLNYLHFPCKFSAQGCNATMLLTDKSTHEESCTWQPLPSFSCPSSLCKWKGAMEQLVPHFRSQHPNINMTQGDRITFRVGASVISSPNSNAEGIRHLNCYSHQFIFIFRKKQMDSSDGHHSRFLVALKLIGTKSEAKTFSYRLTFSDRRPKLMWEGTPLSIYDDLDFSAENNKCLVFERTDAGSRFCLQNGSLYIDVKIEKDNLEN